MSTALSRNPFFQQRSEWAKYKHRILDKYLRVWVYKLASRSDTLAFVDTCAGEGTYGEDQPGSPLIAAQWNDRFLNNRGQRLIVFACEARQSSAAKLAVALEQYSRRTPTQAFVINRAFEDALPEILDATRLMPTLIFIDPFGMKALTADKLAPLLKDKYREPTEVIVRVPPGLLKRFVGWLRTKERDERGTKTASAFRKLLDDLHFDTNTLAEILESDPNGIPDTNELLLSYLQLFSGRFKYVRAFPVRPDYFAAPKYFLVHGTDNEHGLAHMNDVVSTTEDELFDATFAAMEGDQISMFEPPLRQLRVTVNDAEHLILELLAMNGEMDYMALRAQLVLSYGPDLREKHHDLALRRLDPDQIVRIKGKRKDWDRYQLRER